MNNENGNRYTQELNDAVIISSGTCVKNYSNYSLQLHE